MLVALPESETSAEAYRAEGDSSLDVARTTKSFDSLESYGAGTVGNSIDLLEGNAYNV